MHFVFWWFSFVSDGFELLVEIGGNVRQWLVATAGGVVEQVAQQAIGGGVSAEILTEAQGVHDEPA